MARRGAAKNAATPVLDDLLGDGRLARLFSQDARSCALQLWVLQLKSEDVIENRVVYGRLLAYSFSNNRWSSSDNDRFAGLGDVQAQLCRLNLYVESTRCADLLRRLSAGETLAALSNAFELGLADGLRTRFGAVALAAGTLIYRPAAYLLNRDAHRRHAPTSPHGAAGAFSASITRTDKDALFRLGDRYDVALTDLVVRELNAETGLDFSGVDTARFGDLELLVFPGLDDHERPLLTVEWTDGPPTFVARFNPTQVPHFGSFQFRLSIANDDQVVHSAFAGATRDLTGVFECRFEVSEPLCARADTADLEIFGTADDDARQGVLCCQWRGGYIREVHVQGRVAGQGANPIRFDWLEKTTRPSQSARMKAALTVNDGGPGFRSRVGGRDADPWVPVNRDLAQLFTRLHPPRSDGRFFLRWGPSDGEGRLQFVEWLKALLARYQEHQVVIFDPFFETAGLNLLLICGAPQADYIVFTALAKPAKDDESALDARLNNLGASCELNSRWLGRLRLRIFGLKPGRLHDRYILVVASDGLPVAGFHLSNSLQAVAQDHPLLVTPIPADTLLDVEKYKSDLVREAAAARPEGDVETPALRLLFDSKATPAQPRRYEPLRFLEKAQSGDVLSLWAGAPSLQGLSGEALKAELAALSLIRDGSLALPDTPGLRACLDQQAGDFANFAVLWEVLGEVVAHSHDEQYSSYGLKSQPDFLEFLADFLKASFSRAPEDTSGEWATIAARLFLMSFTALLNSANRPEHLFHEIKYAALTWSEYFTIKFLWWFSPRDLVAIAEVEMAKVPEELQGSDAVPMSLLSQVISEISLSVQFEITDLQQDLLLRSRSGLLQWMGLNAIWRQLETPGTRAGALQRVDALSGTQRLGALGWLVRHAARNPKLAEIYDDLRAALLATLPAKVSARKLGDLVDALRGHMRAIGWAEPWLSQDILNPLLQDERASVDDACGIWIDELLALLDPEPALQSRLFDGTREGQTTNVAAFLFAHSSSERQTSSVSLIAPILRRQSRIVQQPLASTSDWSRWDTALMVSLWILAFTRWCQYYLRGSGLSVPQSLEEMSRDAQAVAAARSMDEWRSMSPHSQGALAAFVDQAEKLLAGLPAPSKAPSPATSLTRDQTNSG